MAMAKLLPGLSFPPMGAQKPPRADVILTGTLPRAADAASEFCDSGPLPKPYELQIAVDRIRRLRGGARAQAGL